MNAWPHSLSEAGVLVVVEIAQVEGGFAVVDKTRRSRLLHSAQGNSERQASLVIHEGSEK
jgi:hypothetical protein